MIFLCLPAFFDLIFYFIHYFWLTFFYQVFLDPEMDGQIDIDGEIHLSPHLLESFSGLGSPDSPQKDSETNTRKPLKISSIEAGGMMSLAIDNLGSLWMWGNIPYSSPEGESREFTLVSSGAPVPVWNFHGHTVVKVACGNEHVIALISAGERYEGGDLICHSWGGNNHGQLGLGDMESRLQPEVIRAFSLESSWEVYDIACGAFHTALLAQRKRPSDTLESVCWTFGLGDNGQLGHGTSQTLLSPELVKGLPESIYLVSVDCGLFHTSVVSSAGEVWSWGMENGLGLCPDARFTGTDTGDALSPLLIPCDGLRGARRFPEPLQVACGAAHTVLVADSGYKLWSWGRGRSGVLGNGKTVDFYVPIVVLWPLLIDDFIEDGDVKEKHSEESEEIEKRLSAAMEEMKLLQSKHSIMERYASILHGSIFGKPLDENEIPHSLQSSGTYDIAKEWENMLESSDHRKLARLEMFYRNMLAGVKDKLLKRRIQEIVKECLDSNATRTTE
ncbi:hypothetical protein ACS0TY_012419 [Phlomoides rotata]